MSHSSTADHPAEKWSMSSQGTFYKPSGHATARVKNTSRDRDISCGSEQSTHSQDTNDLPYTAGSWDSSEQEGPPRRGRSWSSIRRFDVADPITIAVVEDRKPKDDSALEFLVANPPKLFRVSKQKLHSKCPIFDQDKNSGKDVPHRYQSMNEFAFALFVRWIDGQKLSGPNDFYTLNHYIHLYNMGCEFKSEELQNMVMDMVRGYYRREQMTAPAFRLEFMYTSQYPNTQMYFFLVATAAYRALSEGKLSAAMETMFDYNHNWLSHDYIHALIKLHHDGMPDPRKGNDCEWHEHKNSEQCAAWEGFEPFESA